MDVRARCERNAPARAPASLPPLVAGAAAGAHAVAQLALIHLAAGSAWCRWARWLRPSRSTCPARSEQRGRVLPALGAGCACRMERRGGDIARFGGDSTRSLLHACTAPRRKENNGNDPSVNLISKSGGWGSAGGGAAPADDAAGKHPERAIPAQPTPAWGGAGLPEERKKQVGAGQCAAAAQGCRSWRHAARAAGLRWR